MANVAGRPNISNEVLDENGRFTSIWYRFMEQMWVRSGGSVDDVSGLRDAIELVELIPNTENIPKDDLLPSIVEKEVQDDLAPRFEIDQDTLTAADIGNIVQAFSADLDIYAANPLTAAELGQLQNINSVTITNAQWAFLGLFNQGLATTDDPIFGEITATTGINLGGTAAANLLDDYEEGTWTPTQSGVTLTVTSAAFTKIGRLVTVAFDITWPATADTTSVNLGGLPFVPSNNSGSGVSGFTDNADLIVCLAISSGSRLAFRNAGGVPATLFRNVDLSGNRVIMSVTYHT